MVRLIHHAMKFCGFYALTSIEMRACILHCLCFTGVYLEKIYHIWVLWEHVVIHTLRSQPLEWQLDVGRFVLAEILLCLHTFSQSKVSNFDDKIHVNPDWLVQLSSMIIITNFWNIATNMQFLAAKSLCTIFILARYSIPLAIWIHISISRFRTTVTYRQAK